MNKNAILIFVKYPQQGFVKTRLAAVIGKEHATALYKCFLDDLFKTLERLTFQKIVCYTPDGSKTLSYFSIRKSYIYMPQHGRDLGERMVHAFENGFDMGFSKLLLIGSDTPNLPGLIFQTAFAALDQNSTVLGPSNDGGYYLIGFSKKTFSKSFFQNVTWSSDQVLAQTIAKLEKFSKSYLLLEEFIDVDDINDLKQIFRNCQGPSYSPGAGVTLFPTCFMI